MSSRRDIPAGFSLIEMMVAMAFLAAIILIVARVMADVSDSWETARRRNETAAAARMMFDLIHRDLAAASVTPDRPMEITASGLRFYTRRPVTEPEDRDAHRTLVQVTYWRDPDADSTTDTAPMRRRQADWETDQTGPDSDATWEDLYPYIRAFRVRGYAHPHQPVTGTLTTAPAYLDLYLEVASPDDQEALDAMVARRRERVVQRFALRVSPGSGTWEARVP